MKLTLTFDDGISSKRAGGEASVFQNTPEAEAPETLSWGYVYHGNSAHVTLKGVAAPLQPSQRAAVYHACHSGSPTRMKSLTRSVAHQPVGPSM